MGFSVVSRIQSLKIEVSSKECGERGPRGGANRQCLEDRASVIRGKIDRENPEFGPPGVLNDCSNAAAGDDDNLFHDAKGAGNQNSDPTLRAAPGARACGGGNHLAGREEAGPDTGVLQGPVKLLEADNRVAAQAPEDGQFFPRPLLGLWTDEPTNAPRAQPNRVRRDAPRSGKVGHAGLAEELAPSAARGGGAVQG